MNQDPDDPVCCWGVVQLFETEVGSFSKSELEHYRSPFELRIERKLYFKEVNAGVLLEELYRAD